jgi:hypothetical protein
VGTTPHERRNEIEVTRADLSADVDRIVDRTSPRRIVRRRTGRAAAALFALDGTVLHHRLPAPLAALPRLAVREASGGPGVRRLDLTGGYSWSPSGVPGSQTQAAVRVSLLLTVIRR